MPKDVIIDPSNGHIYWNDPQSTTQTISISGDVADTINIYGYQLGYVVGSSAGSSTLLATFSDSATNTLIPGTNGYDLGSASKRWELFATAGNFSGSIGCSSTATIDTSVSTPIYTSSASMVIKPGANSTAAMQYQTSSGVAVMTIDTINSRIGIGTTSPSYDLEVNGEISATNKSFVIDHPTKPGMKLRYGSLEGPENGVYVRGRIEGKNVIELPDYWRGLVDLSTITVHLTPVGSFSNAYVDIIADNKIYIKAALFNKINCFYIVYAERKDIPKMKVEF
jgi:hypothetical protein